MGQPGPGSGPRWAAQLLWDLGLGFLIGRMGRSDDFSSGVRVPAAPRGLWKVAVTKAEDQRVFPFLLVPESVGILPRFQGFFLPRSVKWILNPRERSRMRLSFIIEVKYTERKVNH